MRVVRFAALFFLLIASVCCFAGDDWLPITPQDLAYKEVPGNPGAPAVMLYHRHDIDDTLHSEFLYYRIKILSNTGKRYADVEIPVLNVRVDLDGLKARTVRPDGSIVEFNGKVFEKTVFKGRGIKLAVKTFTMPEVAEGCILEYKFRLAYRKTTFPPTSEQWELQHNLFTVKETFAFNPYGGEPFMSSSAVQFSFPGANISAVSTNLKDKDRPKSRGNNYELELHDVPAFESEDYMPPDNNFKPLVQFVYIPRGDPGTDHVWREIGKDFYEGEERFMSVASGVKEAALEAVGNETDPEKKLRKLYARVQQVRNLSYEPRRDRDEMKAENLKRNDYVGDVLHHGYGFQDEITILFIVMARAAGFEVSDIHASDRKEMFFSKELLSLGRREAILAGVTVGGKEIYLAPGTKFCPFGLVPWHHTSTDALRLDKKGGTFIKIPPDSYDKSMTQRVAVVSIGENGTLKGEIAVQFTGQEALEHRLDAVDDDDAGKKKSLEDEMKNWLPPEATVKLLDAQGWQGTDTPLTARFSVEIGSYASAAGKRLLLPAYLFQVRQRNAFKHGERKYPVYFPYPFAEVDQIKITLPTGYTLESVPQKQEAKLGYAKYQSVSQLNGTQLVTQRSLLFNGVYVDLSKYAELKTFFGTVQTGDEQQAVLHAGGNTSDPKGN